MELDSNSPLAEQPLELVTQLKQHQLASLHKCLQMESGAEMKVRDVMRRRDVILRTKVGIIGDGYGAGKSFVMMALMTHKMSQDPKPVTLSYHRNAFSVESMSTHKRVETNVLIIPYHTLRQWTAYLAANLPNQKVAIVDKRSSVKAIVEHGVEEFSIIIVTSAFVHDCTGEVQGFKFNRLFVDEADSLKLRHSYQSIDASFTWFSSAIPESLVHPNGLAIFENNKHILSINELESKGFIKELFFGIGQANLTQHCVVRSSPAFVDECFGLPAINSVNVRCRSPSTNRGMSGLVSVNIMNALHAGNIEEALSFINPKQIGTEQDIMQMLIEKHTTSPDRIAATAGGIKERFETTQCSICYEEIGELKSIVPCCSNVFCFECINQWMATKTHACICPMCAVPLTSSSLHVVGNVSVDASRPKIEDKVETIVRLLRDFGKERRVLVFSFCDIFDQLDDELSSVGISCARLAKSNAAILQAIKAYSAGGVQVLFVDAAHYGCGLNLEMTTDVVIMHTYDANIHHRIVGRAQRSGRSTPLNVWQLLYENEFPKNLEQPSPLMTIHAISERTNQVSA